MSKNIYKIECFSDCGTKIVKNTIEGSGGKCFVAGHAIVTDYAFNSTELNGVIPFIGITHGFEDLTQFDIDGFMGSAK